MPEPRPGDFFLVPIQGRVGLLIKFGQWLNGDGWRSIQHAGIYLGEGRTIEAMPGGAIEGDISNYRPENIIWSSGLEIYGVGPDYDGPLTDNERQIIVFSAVGRYKGVPYSFLDYFGLALARFRLRPRWLKRYIASTGHMICSQLVDQCYHDAGIRLFQDGRIPGDVTPADLYNLLVKTKDYDERDERSVRIP
jgi:cell wall-associated NlpC family hydrolase